VEEINVRIDSDVNMSYIEVAYVESELEHLPSICVSVEVENEGFKGKNKNIWFEIDKINEFINKLQNNDSVAILDSMSPGEFVLEVGRKYVRYKMYKTIYCPDVNFITLNGVFGIYRGSNIEIAEKFKKLLLSIE
jgi:hypothetical protein